MRIFKGSALAALGALGIAMPAGTALAATIDVPADQPSIQLAIDAAAAGDEVVVAPGVYRENINFKGKAITVHSAAGPAVTVIDGRQLGSVVVFITGEGQGSVLRGFTLRNGSASSSGGGGIRIVSASPRILNNIVTGNTACASGTGIYVQFGSPLILGNTITDNTTGCSGGSGGGITLQGSGSAQIVNNTIRNNRNSFGGGIGLNSAGTPVIRNNVIAGNTATSRGGGIEMVNSSNALIVQNLITGNTAPEGGGVAWGVPSGQRGPRLVNNTIADNNATTQGRGSAIYAGGFDKDVDLVNNVLVGRTGQTVVHCDGTNDPNPPRFKNNDVYTASGTLYGGICTNQTGTNGNLSADPLLSADFLPQAGSPCIDQGDSAAADIPLTDLKGKARVLDGNGDGSTVIDLGVGEG
jgi:parallel beta-helix repeat protein